MNKQKHILVNANEAVARMAYKTNEVCAIYPITPASQMSELVEEWSAKQYRNIFDCVPLCQQMQSEAGVAGAMHGALQTGSLSTTFTASQGLLLMLPNMYKIAGELTPNVIHVATRTIATHALSIFGDHSDVMAVRASGYAMLASASVQEAMDFALIAQLATLKSRIPFLHFFDGFRTSHETQKIVNINDEMIEGLIDNRLIDAHRQRALNPNTPVIRGTTQGPDTFFQSREVVNTYYDQCPGIVQEIMDLFGEYTGRSYQLFEYHGHPKAENVLISMASSSETIAETVDYLNKNGEKVGLIKVRLYRPFSKEHLLTALPNTCKKVAVLDRTKESGAIAEPLFQDVTSALHEAFQSNRISSLPQLFGGRYGLSSKEFTPSMVASIFDNLSQPYPKTNFTVGIWDNVKNQSLPKVEGLLLQEANFQALFYGYKNAPFQAEFSKLLLDLSKDENSFLQSYTEIDYKKSNSRHVHNLRVANDPIKAPYLIQKANFIYCDTVDFLVHDNVLNRVANDAAIFIRTTEKSSDFWCHLPESIQKTIQSKSLDINLIESDFSLLYDLIKEIYFHDGKEINDLRKVDTSPTNSEIPLEADYGFTETFLGKLLAGKGDGIPVGDFPIDGTYPLGTAQYTQNRNKGTMPVWDLDACTQCGLCTLACPQTAIRVKVFDDEYLGQLQTLKSTKAHGLGDSFNLLNYTIQVNPDQCTSCNLCVDACEANALKMKDTNSVKTLEKKNWTYFETIPEFDRAVLEATKLNQQQLQEPLFKYSLGEDGCGQAPYLKLLSQLFGDRMLVANATGASSIFGGALPTTPWAQNHEGRGPAWSNSLFEDNAEFGLGFQLSQKIQKEQAKKLLVALEGKINSNFIQELLECPQNTASDFKNQRIRVEQLKSQLTQIEEKEAKKLLPMVDSFVKKSVWIVGGDGWAYDIGFGGLDHVLASGENVNILVLDNELYSNTGGQQSKATPKGATAKFGYHGKSRAKKDLGMMAMNYEGVYVGSVAIGADPDHTLQTLIEAESYDGPSLVIAYCQSPEHGIQVKAPKAHQKMAVASGHWILYRNDPRRQQLGLPTVQLDSETPNISVNTYFEMERRFSKALADRPEILSSAQADIDKRYEHFVSLSKKGQTIFYEPLNY